MGCGVSKTPPKGPAIPENLEPELVPFYSVSGGAGVLQRNEIENCLKAIGMRKSVLALAVDPMEKKGVKGQDDYSVKEWWDEVNSRSKIVIKSKLGDEGQQVIFALACTVSGTGRLRKVSASKADLSRALVELGLEEDSPELKAMLAGCKDTGNIQLDPWFGKLSPESVAKLKELLNAD